MIELLIKRCCFLFIVFCSVQSLCAQEEEDHGEEFETEEDVLSADSAVADSLFEDSYFEEFLRSVGYYFDSTLIPWHGYYNLWDTRKIHPYQQCLDSVCDSTLLILADNEDCFFHPPALGHITSHFGMRRWGRRYKFHYGTDLKLQVGDPVYAVFDGVIRIAQYSKSYGYVVVVRHYNGLETIYAHFSKLLVVPGMAIRAGEPLGLGGSTGRSTGPHLHFEMRYKGMAFSPEKVINFQENKLISDSLYISKDLYGHIKEVNKINAARYHKIKSGETLGHIARRYGTTVKNIQRLNGMKNTNIRAGRTIRVR
jgi:LysM repeat protein